MIQKQTYNLSIYQSHLSTSQIANLMEEQTENFTVPTDEELLQRYKRFRELQDKYFGGWDSKQVQKISSQRKQPDNKMTIQKQQTIAPEPEKKKRKNEFQISQRLLKKQNQSYFEKHPNKNLRKYSEKYFEYLQSLRENDFSAFKDYEFQIQAQQKCKTSTKKQQSNREAKSKRVKKKQVYMPSVVKTIQKPYLINQDRNFQEKMPISFKKDSAIVEFQIKKDELRKKSLQEQLQMLQSQLSNQNISENEKKFLIKQRKLTSKKIQGLQKILVRKKMDLLQSEKRADVKLVPKVEKSNTEKPKTQYQKYMKQENDKKARKELLLRQEELKVRRQKEFEEALKKTGNPIYAVSQLQDEISRKGRQMIKQLQKLVNQTNKFPNKLHRQKKFKKQQQIKTEQIKNKPQKLRKNRSREKFQSSVEDSTSRQELPQWKRQLMTITRYDPTCQKYRRRDTEEIYQSGFSQIEKQDKYSRKMARKQEKQAEADGQVEDV